MYTNHPQYQWVTVEIGDEIVLASSHPLMTLPEKSNRKGHHLSDLSRGLNNLSRLTRAKRTSS